MAIPPVALEDRILLRCTTQDSPMKLPCKAEDPARVLSIRTAIGLPVRKPIGGINPLPPHTATNRPLQNTDFAPKSEDYYIPTRLSEGFRMRAYTRHTLSIPRFTDTPKFGSADFFEHCINSFSNGGLP